MEHVRLDGAGTGKEVGAWVFGLCKSSLQKGKLDRVAATAPSSKQHPTETRLAHQTWPKMMVTLYTQTKEYVCGMCTSLLVTHNHRPGFTSL